MKFKNWKKNRSILLAHDLITYNLSNLQHLPKKAKNQGLKQSNLFNKKQIFNMLNYWHNIEVVSNVDFKPFRGVSFNSSEGQSTKFNSKLKLLITFYLIKKITGQLPYFIKAKKSVANFNIRAGMDVGIKITLRNTALEQFYKNYNLIMLPIKGINKLTKDNIETDFSIKSLSFMQPLNGYLIFKDTWSIFKHIKPLKFSGEEIKELLNISNKIKIEQEQIGAHLRFNIDNHLLQWNPEIKRYILNYYIIPS